MTDIKINVAYDRTLAALSHVKEAADVLAEVIINQGVHSPSFEEKLKRNSEFGTVMPDSTSDRAQWDGAFAKPVEGRSIPDAARDVRAEVKKVCDDMRASIPEVASIHDMADKLRDENQKLIRELNEKDRRLECMEQSTKRYASDADYYMNIVDRIANELGPDAFTADDGVRGDSPIRDKVYVLARNAIYREGLLQHTIKHIGAKLIPFANVLNDAGELDLNMLEQGFTSVLSGYADLLASAPNVGKLREQLEAMTRIAAKNGDNAAEANRELSETNQALKIVVKERDDAREAVKYAQNLATRESDMRAEYARKLETNSKNLNKMDAELQGVVKERDNVSDNLNYTIKLNKGLTEENIKLRDAIATHSDAVTKLPALRDEVIQLTFANKELQRRIGNALNQLDVTRGNE